MSLSYRVGGFTERRRLMVAVCGNTPLGGPKRARVGRPWTKRSGRVEDFGTCGVTRVSQPVMHVEGCVRRGAAPAWDSVTYGSASLGFVDAGHQSLATRAPRRECTWYHAVVARDSPTGRRWLQQQPWTAWRDYILNDLTRAHSDIAECVERIDVMRWGHAMARPLPGVLDRVARLKAWTPAPRVFVAHADMSSLSLFKEAQWHGVSAAERAVRAMGQE